MEEIVEVLKGIREELRLLRIAKKINPTRYYEQREILRGMRSRLYDTLTVEQREQFRNIEQKSKEEADKYLRGETYV